MEPSGLRHAAWFWLSGLDVDAVFSGELVIGY